MGTERAIERAGDGLTTRWLLGVPAVVGLCLLTLSAVAACGPSLVDKGPEVIRYCAESAGAGTPLLETTAGCIVRP
jgi:hypothetical protein